MTEKFIIEVDRETADAIVSKYFEWKYGVSATIVIDQPGRKQVLQEIADQLEHRVKTAKQMPFYQYAGIQNGIAMCKLLMEKSA